MTETNEISSLPMNDVVEIPDLKSVEDTLTKEEREIAEEQERKNQSNQAMIRTTELFVFVDSHFTKLEYMKFLNIMRTENNTPELHKFYAIIDQILYYKETVDKTEYVATINKLVAKQTEKNEISEFFECFLNVSSLDAKHYK